MPPAARKSDMHASCPGKHVGGPIQFGCEESVEIDGLAAARKGDLCVCQCGGLDPIAQSSTSVFIGGKLAARVGDTTQHGGVIVKGCPTVLIGDDEAGGGKSKKGTKPGSRKGKSNVKKTTSCGPGGGGGKPNKPDQKDANGGSGNADPTKKGPFAEGPFVEADPKQGTLEGGIAHWGSGKQSVGPDATGEYKGAVGSVTGTNKDGTMGLEGKAIKNNWEYNFGNPNNPHSTIKVEANAGTATAKGMAYAGSAGNKVGAGLGADVGAATTDGKIAGRTQFDFFGNKVELRGGVGGGLGPSIGAKAGGEMYTLKDKGGLHGDVFAGGKLGLGGLDVELGFSVTPPKK